MARKPRQLDAELEPAPPLPQGITLESDGAVLSEAWVRATAILLRGMARREARLSTGSVETSFGSIATVATLQKSNIKLPSPM